MKLNGSIQGCLSISTAAQWILYSIIHLYLQINYRKSIQYIPSTAWSRVRVSGCPQGTVRLLYRYLGYYIGKLLAKTTSYTH